MARQSVFPAILVEEISVHNPPFDESGVIQEFVGEGVYREYEALRKAADFSDDTVGRFIREAEDMIGPIRDTYRIRYSLLVRAATGTFISERGAKARARAFTRVKNPFEPEFIHIRRIEEVPELSEAMVMGKRLGTVYRVVTEVTK